MASPFLDPGGLDGLQDFLSATLRIVGELWKFHHPAPQIDEVDVSRIDLRLAFVELDGDFQHIGPFQARARSSLPPGSVAFRHLVDGVLGNLDHQVFVGHHCLAG